MAHPTQEKIEQILKKEGIERYGFAALRRPLSMEIYKEWLRDGCHGDMDYLKRHYRKKAQPHRQFASMKTAIVIAHDYYPHPKSLALPPLSNSPVALYARGEDYHHWLKDMVAGLILALEAEFPQDNFLPFTDSGPVLERDLAYRAGLGWIGKNTCLIDQKKGSLHFLAEIYMSLTWPFVELPAADRCGKCQKCIDACPTEALAPQRLDANRCISYWTIEAKQVAPVPLQEPIGEYLFGCDICQTVCPWNQHAFKIQGLEPPSKKGPRENLIKDLRWILISSNREISKYVRGTPLERAGGRGLKRNALYVIQNQKLGELINEVQVLTAHPRLGPLARQTLKFLQ